MEPQNIGDIPQFKKIITQIQAIKLLKGSASLLQPLGKLLNIDIQKAQDILDNLDENIRLAEELIGLPDQFNEIFGSRGWISYNLLNVDIAKKAILEAANNIDNAEDILISYYTPEILKINLQWLSKITAIKPRLDLYHKAIDDYLHERYYASILVVLSLTDGLVNEVSENRRGLSAEDADLRAWDTIAGHSTGLRRLTNIIQTGRRKTSSDTITLPYRHGIMHGMDLGYNNKAVAAKSWALLFAVGEWAQAVQSGVHREPPAEQPLSFLEQTRKCLSELKESIQKYHTVKQERELAVQWKPRTIEINSGIPESGSPDDYGDETPERALAVFFDLWKRKNYGEMAKYVSQYDQQRYGNKLPKELRDIFDRKRLNSFKFISIRDKAAAVTVIQVNIVYELNGHSIPINREYRMMYEGTDGKPLIRMLPGRWIVFNYHV